MRLLSRLVAALLALALTVVGALTVIEVVAAALGADPIVLPHDDWARNGRTTHWDDTSVRVALIVIGVIGLALLYVAIARRRPDRVAVTPPAGVEAAEIRRHSLERSLERVAAQVDGVADADVRLDDTNLKIAVTTHRRDSSGLREAIEQAVAVRLKTFRLAETPTLRVTTRTRKT